MAICKFAVFTRKADVDHARQQVQALQADAVMMRQHSNSLQAKIDRIEASLNTMIRLIDAACMRSRIYDVCARRNLNSAVHAFLYI